jgi:hypothetical protein
MTNFFKNDGYNYKDGYLSGIFRAKYCTQLGEQNLRAACV